MQYLFPVLSVPKGITSPLHESRSKKCLILPFIPRRTSFAEIIEVMKKFFKIFSCVSLPPFIRLSTDEKVANDIYHTVEKCRQKTKRQDAYHAS